MQELKIQDIIPISYVIRRVVKDAQDGVQCKKKRLCYTTPLSAFT